MVQQRSLGTSLPILVLLGPLLSFSRPLSLQQAATIFLLQISYKALEHVPPPLMLPLEVVFPEVRLHFL